MRIRTNVNIAVVSLTSILFLERMHYGVSKWAVKFFLFVLHFLTFISSFSWHDLNLKRVLLFIFTLHLPYKVQHRRSAHDLWPLASSLTQTSLEGWVRHGAALPSVSQIVCNEAASGAKMAAAVSLAVEMWSVIRDGISIRVLVTSCEAVRWSSIQEAVETWRSASQIALHQAPWGRRGQTHRGGMKLNLLAAGEVCGLYWFFISSVQCQVQSCWSVTFLLVHVRFTRTELLQAGNHISFRQSWTDPWCSCSASFVGRFPSCETLSLQSFMSPVRNQQTRRKHLENVNNFRWNRPSAILTLEQEDTLKGPANKHIAEFNINQGDWFVRTEVDGPRPQARRTTWGLTSPCFQTRLKLSSATIKNSNKTSPNCEITYNNTVCWSL